MARWLLVVAVGFLAAPLIAQDVQVDCVERPSTAGGNPHYLGNRAPLQPAALLELPAGSIRPRGWLRRQLELMADGFTGRLGELSRFLKKDGNAWLDPGGEGHSGWEEVPYWLRGFLALGVALEDERILAEARVWVAGVLASQRADGYFGPRSNLTRIGGARPDVWAHMVMLDVLRTWYEHSGDERVIELMKGFFRWQAGLADEDFLEPYWQHQRGGDNLAAVLWLYNLCGEEWLLELARKTHRNTAPWDRGIANWHGVNIAQGFREPAQFGQLSGELAHRGQAERSWREVMDLYGRVPGGMFGADENCRKGCEGPRQAAETCTMVEMMLSCEMLLAIGGDPVWADRCEDVAFNSLPAAMSADLKALRYLTAPNHVRSDKSSKAPGLQNSGPMLEFNPHIHRCCQHNTSHGWPYFDEHLWYATPDSGLAALLYAPCEVRAKVGAGVEVTLAVRTRYPFRERIEIELGLGQPARFPLYLRVPGWCEAPALSLNGAPLENGGRPGTYLRLARLWQPGDRLVLELPMSLAVGTWPAAKGMVAIQRGPLTYSLAIGERREPSGGTEEWPAFELHPTTPWNYGLALERGWPAGEVELEERPWPADEQPFTVEAAPIELRLAARRIPAWKEDALGLVGPLQPSPTHSDEPLERVRLIPMGCARLRIAAFPTVSSRARAQWLAPRTPLRTRVSHCFSGDTPIALSDGVLPESSADQGLARFTWWPRKGSAEWVAYEFEEAREVGAVAVYWFDDRPQGGGCRAPLSWRLLYREGEEWKPARPLVGERFGVGRDAPNQVRLEPFASTALRLEVQLEKGFSGGILEWSVHPPEQAAVRALPGEAWRSFSEDGAWCWFADPRALHHASASPRTYAGWVDRAGSVVVGALDHASGEIEHCVLRARLDRDDHANPALLLLPDGRLQVFYTRHSGRKMYARIARKPGDIQDWEEELAFDPNSRRFRQQAYCYPNPARLVGEGGRFYLFWRGDDWKPCFATSADGREWSGARIAVARPGAGGSNRPYLKMCSDGDERVHLAFTDGHPRNEPTNSIYYACLRGGAMHGADGQRLAGLDELPLAHARADCVYRADGDGGRAWIWDVAFDAEQRPVIVYARLPREEEHRYHYARWNGARWEDHLLCVAGGWFPQTPEGKREREPHYSGGVVLDHGDPSVVYLSREVEGIFEIECWRTSDGGESWKVEPITSGSKFHNVRPVAIRDHPAGGPRVLWMNLHGGYEHYTRYHAAIKMDARVR